MKNGHRQLNGNGNEAITHLQLFDCSFGKLKYKFFNLISAERLIEVSNKLSV